MVESKKKPRKGAGLVAFKAHLEGERGIKRMIEDGHTTIVIFEAFEKKMPIKAQQFGKYVRQLKQLMKGNENGNYDRAREAEKGKAVIRKEPIRTRTPDQPAFVSSDTPRDKDSLIKRKG